MANIGKTTMKEDPSEKMFRGIPYNSIGFRNWLVTSRTLSEKEAQKQVDLIREADVELWEPGKPELFRNLGEWLEEARKASSETLRSLYLDFAFTLLVSHIQELKELKETLKKDGKRFLSAVITAFEWYETFLRSTLNYYEYDPELYENYDFEEKPKRYPKIPLDNEFNQYLKESKYSDRLRHKMVSNLRKLNALVINNGRGDSDWLQKIVDKAKAGENIRYARLMANTIVHSVIDNIDGTEGITESALRGALSTLNHYLDFLIRIYLLNKK
ncbi:MAG: hypothetical protein K2N35_12220 [Muribaculaceae bacterium]|nr:hypothetical protein [Muribaculaceae bacterium]MDE7420963.1 hypothetical protein [Muribaculaceae bacterium]